MNRIMQLTRSTSAAALALMLGACGDATTNINEREPEVIIPDTPTPPEPTELHAGRLVISALNSSDALVWDLETAAVLDSFSAIGTISAVYAAPGHRYAALMQRNDDLVEFIDGGVWQEDHVAHLHDYIQDPQFADFTISGDRPTHVAITDDQFAIFFDGNADLALPAEIGVFAQGDIEQDNRSFPRFTYDQALHGAAQPRGEFVLAGVMSDSNTSPLPDRVAVMAQEQDIFVEQQVFAEPCERLHGSAQTMQQVAFGCDDGVLLITQQGQQFSAVKVAEPVDFSDTARIGTLYSHAEQGHLIGYARPDILVSVSAGGMAAIDWSAAQGASPVSVQFADDGEKMVILDSTGQITVLHVEQSGEWHLEGQVAASQGELANMPEGARFELVVSGADHMAYMLDPITAQVVNIDLDAVSVTGRVDLDWVPGKLAWVGITGEVGEVTN